MRTLQFRLIDSPAHSAQVLTAQMPWCDSRTMKPLQLQMRLPDMVASSGSAAET